MPRLPDVPRPDQVPHLGEPAPPADPFLLGLAPTIDVLLRRDGPQCWICGSTLISDRKALARISAHRDPRRHAPTRDHVIPSLHLGRKPLDHHWNLRPACSSCNGSKNHYVPHWAFLRWDLLQAAPPTSAMLEKIRSASKRASFWWPKPLPPPLAIFIEGGSPPYPSALLQHLPSHSSSAPTMAAH